MEQPPSARRPRENAQAREIESVVDSAAPSNQPNRAWAWPLGFLFALCLVLAASSDPVDLWRAPVSSPEVSVPVTIDDVATSPTPSNPLDSETSPLSFVVLLVVALVALSLLGDRLGGGAFVSLAKRRFGWSSNDQVQQDPLPPVPARDVDSQITEARAALFGGDARNGIVACWMRLEHGAFEAGLARQAAETAEEYSRRLISTASIDSTAMSELAGLYREARFSSHRLTEAHRARASAALDDVGRALESSGINIGRLASDRAASS